MLLMTSESWTWGSIRVYGWQSVGWTAESLKWLMRRHEVAWSSSIKYQEIQLDPRISFGEHLRIATKKAIQCGAYLARLMPYISGPREAKRRLVTGDSKLLYAAPVWASALDNHAIQKRLSLAQRGAAMRLSQHTELCWRELCSSWRAFRQ